MGLDTIDSVSPQYVSGTYSIYTLVGHHPSCVGSQVGPPHIRGIQAAESVNDVQYWASGTVASCASGIYCAHLFSSGTYEPMG